MRRLPSSYGLVLALTVFPPLMLPAVDKNFHNAPDSTKALKDPVEGQPQALEEGRRLYARNCLSCHGKNGQGSGNVPSLADAKLDSVPAGEVFWFITKGSKENGMPSWAFLPEKQRWQIVSYVQALGQTQNAPGGGQKAESTVPQKLNAPRPTPPFTDFRYEKPGQIRKITLKDLPAPFATASAANRSFK